MTIDEQEIIGVLTDKSQADAAFMALEQAGFQPQHITSDSQKSSGFFATIKNILTGHTSSTSENTQEITEIPISHDEVRFYERELEEGHAVLALPVDERAQEAIDILHAHNAMTNYPLALIMQPKHSTEPSPQDTQDNIKHDDFPAKTTIIGKADITEQDNTQDIYQPLQEIDNKQREDEPINQSAKKVIRAKPKHGRHRADRSRSHSPS